MKTGLLSSQWGVLVMLLSLWLPQSLSQQTTSPSPQQKNKLKFRLAGYPRKHNEGRIEVFYNEEWGTFCDDDFSLENAHVLCRHLGFISATGWTHSAKYGKGTGKIWLDNVQCRGSEKSITDCKSQGWGNSDCTHDEDAGVVCKDERLPGFVESNVIEGDICADSAGVFTGCRKRTAVAQQPPVSHGSDTGRSALLNAPRVRKRWSTTENQWERKKQRFTHIEGGEPLGRPLSSISEQAS
ncbi:LOXL3 oxidase, partial [Polyodon spathula]|nr:LOXL3 oxidase [Polyodon spathula]